MKPEFRRLMSHTLTIRRRARNWEGNFIDTAIHSGERGFVEYGKQKVTDRKGEEVLASAIVFLCADAPVDLAHEHWMIDQTAPYSRSDMEVIRIDPMDDPRTGRTHHFEVAVR